MPLNRESQQTGDAGASMMGNGNAHQAVRLMNGDEENSEVLQGGFGSVTMLPKVSIVLEQQRQQKLEEEERGGGLNDTSGHVEQTSSSRGDGGAVTVAQHNQTRAELQSKRNILYSVVSIVLLMLQGTMMSIVLRYSRIQKGPSYLPSVSVFLGEAIKLSICFCYRIAFGADTEESSGLIIPGGGERIRKGMVRRVKSFCLDALPMALPASMFVLQQILLVWSATYLDAVTYQIFNQAFKLVPTAIFARLLLGQKLKPIQWLSIPVLAVGVIIITSNTSNTSSSVKKGIENVSSLDWYLAMTACSVSGLSSAFAGVYFEKYVKGKLAAGLIKRNTQLGIFGVPFSLSYAYFKDRKVLYANGWLSGFSPAAWGVVWLQVFGGFIIAVVVKYCDNILKNFALAGSVILTVLISIPLFDQWPSSLFLFGVASVLLSVFMYSGNMKMPKGLLSAHLSLIEFSRKNKAAFVLLNFGAALLLFFIIRGSRFGR